jgi:hypothetical protein
MVTWLEIRKCIEEASKLLLKRIMADKADENKVAMLLHSG